jgi:hypothetical protein
MATAIIYADTSDGYISSSAVGAGAYTIVREGISLSANDSFESITCGQRFNIAQTAYYCYEMFLQYNTSTLPGDAVLTSVTESLYSLYGADGEAFTQEVRSFDWGSSLETADWRAGANLGSYLLLSSLNTGGITAGYNIFPSTSNFRNAINKSGYTRLMHNSSRHRAGIAPTTYESTSWCSANYAGTTQDPKLTITYAIDITGAATITGTGSLTASGEVEAYGAAAFTGAGDLTAAWSMQVSFLDAPTVTVRTPVATHVTVRSPTHSYTAHITPEPPEGTKIERIEDISTGDAAVCQSVAEALIARWGRTQLSVEGVIPLNVSLQFKQKLHITIPQAGIDENMVLQRKEHDIFADTTAIVCGDIILDDSELIARILQDLTNK